MIELVDANEALEGAGVRRVRLHDLRHSYGTRMAAVGTPMRALMEYLGHASIQTTMIYAAFSPDPAGGAAHANRAFAPQGTELSETEVISGH